MKVKTVIYILLICIICGCENDSEPLFSFDPVKDSYVKNNIQELSTLEIQDISALSKELQRAVYRSYTPEKRYELWTERLNLILYTEEWTNEETIHIISLIDYLCPEVFSGDDTKLIEKGIDLNFSDHWMKFGYDNLLWDVNKMAFVISSLDISYSEFLHTVKGIKDLKKTAKAGSETCNCNQSTSFCYPGMCNDTGCNKTNGGCGWLWLQECNGECLLEQ